RGVAQSHGSVRTVRSPGTEGWHLTTGKTFQINWEAKHAIRAQRRATLARGVTQAACRAVADRQLVPRGDSDRRPVPASRAAELRRADRRPDSARRDGGAGGGDRARPPRGRSELAVAFLDVDS